MFSYPYTESLGSKLILSSTPAPEWASSIHLPVLWKTPTSCPLLGDHCHRKKDWHIHFFFLHDETDMLPTGLFLKEINHQYLNCLQGNLLFVFLFPLSLSAWTHGIFQIILVFWKSSILATLSRMLLSLCGHHSKCLYKLSLRRLTTT